MSLRRETACALALALFDSLFINIAMLCVPIYDMQLYDRVIQSHNLSTLAALSAACLLGLAIYALMEFLRSSLLVIISERLFSRLSTPVLCAAVRRSVGGEAPRGVEALRDLNDLRSFLASGMVTVPLDALITPLFLAILFRLHPAYGWLCLTGIAASLLCSLLADACARDRVVAAEAERAAVAAELAGRLADREVADGLGMLPAILGAWQRRQDRALAGLLAAGTLAGVLAGLSRLSRLVLQASVMALGAVMILAHKTTPGSLMGANLLLNKSVGPFDQMLASWRAWVLAIASWRRLRDLLGAAGNAVVREAIPGEAGLVLRGVRYTAPGGMRPLVAGIDLVLAPGSIAVMQGPNGAGKSTLLRLMAGVIIPDEGEIRLDGVAITDTDRARIGYLPQGVQLLDGPVADGIGRLRDGAARMEQVIVAARQAGVHELIGRLPRGYDTAITATSLSGGQAQRLGLARALFDTPRLLVLDEPDASLDHEGEQALAAALTALRARGGIIVLTTHRTALLGGADMIIELKEGQAPTCIEAARPERLSSSLLLAGS